MDTYSTLKKEILTVNQDILKLFSTAKSIPGMADYTFGEWEKTCESLPGQLAENTIRVAIVGTIKSGKSTFLNSIFKGEYVKRGAGVITSIVTRVRNAKRLRAKLFFKSWDEVNAEMERRRAERQRVLGLLEKVQDKSDEEKVRYLIDNDVAEPLILELAGVDQSAIDSVNKAMEEEIKEKQRLAEEEAARKKKEAEGPALEDIPADEMLAHIEAVREIMEFSDVEKEIRTMCEQSAIPKALVDIAVSDPDKLDELEKQAEG